MSVVDVRHFPIPLDDVQISDRMSRGCSSLLRISVDDSFGSEPRIVLPLWMNVEER